MPSLKLTKSAVDSAQPGTTDYELWGRVIPEGPIALADGSMYVTEMLAATSCIMRLDPAGRRSVIKKTGGRPNGLAIDGEGLIWIVEAILCCVICITPDGREIPRIHGPDGEPFLFPNDLAFGPDGHLI